MDSELLHGRKLSWDHGICRRLRGAFTSTSEKRRFVKKTDCLSWDPELEIVWFERSLKQNMGHFVAISA